METPDAGTGRGGMSEQSTEVIVVTRARFATIDLERMASLRARVVKVVSAVPGFVSSSMWEMHDDPFSFLNLVQFATEEDSLKAWDTMVRSPVMEILANLMSEAPNTMRFFVRKKTGLSLEDTKVGHFVSLSTRISGLGYESNLLKEINDIFEELRLIPGYLGSLTGQHTDIAEEVLGLVFWENKQAFEASLPKKTLYRINLYQRVL